MAGPSPEESARVRSYLVAQAAKLGLPELVAKVRDDAAGLEAAAAAIPAGRFAERPAEGEWSAAEICGHVLHVGESGAAAIEGILAGRGVPARAPRDEMDPGQAVASAAAFWEPFAARREQLFARVLAARGDEHLDVRLNHGFFGDLNWREWLLFMRVHDLDHLRQLQAAAAALA